MRGHHGAGFIEDRGAAERNPQHKAAHAGDAAELTDVSRPMLGQKAFYIELDAGVCHESLPHVAGVVILQCGSALPCLPVLSRVRYNHYTLVLHLADR